MKEFPQREEVVICRVTKILDYGVFVELLEYPDVTGFVHVSNVASSWVKNIRNFVKENQVRAGKVTFVDREKNQVDIAFNKVSDNQQRVRINEYNLLKRSQKIIELLARESKKTYAVVWQEVAEPLLQNYISLWEAFSKIREEGINAAKDVPDAWKKILVDALEKNIPMPEKEIQKTVKIKSFEPNGVEIIKNDVTNAMKKAVDVKSDVIYLGSGKYLIKIISPSFKKSDQVMARVIDELSSSIKKSHGEFELAKEESG